MTEQEWVIEALRFYRPLEFFTEFSHLSDEELADELIALNLKNGNCGYLQAFVEGVEPAGEFAPWEMGPPKIYADMLLLRHDTSRIWWAGGEVDISPGAAIYSNFLTDCCHISRGAFAIDNVEEEWEDSTLTGISFDFGDNRWRICPSDMHGWIDWTILDGINRLIENSGYKFFINYTGDEAFILVLTDAERQQFESGRKWSF